MSQQGAAERPSVLLCYLLSGGRRGRMGEGRTPRLIVLYGDLSPKMARTYSPRRPVGPREQKNTSQRCNPSQRPTKEETMHLKHTPRALNAHLANAVFFWDNCQE